MHTTTIEQYNISNTLLIRVDDECPLWIELSIDNSYTLLFFNLNNELFDIFKF